MKFGGEGIAGKDEKFRVSTLDVTKKRKPYAYKKRDKKKPMDQKYSMKTKDRMEHGFRKNTINNIHDGSDSYIPSSVAKALDDPSTSDDKATPTLCEYVDSSDGGVDAPHDYYQCEDCFYRCHHDMCNCGPDDSMRCPHCNGAMTCDSEHVFETKRSALREHCEIYPSNIKRLSIMEVMDRIREVDEDLCSSIDTFVSTNEGMINTLFDFLSLAEEQDENLYHRVEEYVDGNLL